MPLALLLRPIDSPAATGTRVGKVFTVLMTTGVLGAQGHDGPVTSGGGGSEDDETDQSRAG